MSDGVPKDYKASLNLPQTGFPMKGNLAELEPRLIAQWESQRTFHAMLEKHASAPTFVLHDGPPYANGPLHAGHALNKVLKDIVVKFQTLAGQRADFVPGWDCHGLPIEQAVEKRLREQKTDRRTLPREVFLQRCRDYALDFVNLQRDEFKRLGVLGRWAEPYQTLDFSYEAQELRELATLAERGLLYRKNKPVYWCTVDQTALAESEVEYDESHVSPSTYVAFPSASDLAARFPALAGRQVSFLIWTTTAWTLPANRAICVHPELEYVFYALDQARVVVIARELLLPVLEVIAPQHLKSREVQVGEAVVGSTVLADSTRLLAYASGRELEHLRYRHVFLDRESPIICGEHVTLEAGTGLVHTAPGHGQEDYVVGLAYGLEVDSPVRGDGRFDETVPEALRGLKVFEANPVIVDWLHELGVLLNPPGQTLTHKYPTCWRCRNDVLFRATPQWFIALDATGLRASALDQVDRRVEWIPKWGRDRIRGMLETRPDWCISRQRTWGVPIPALFCERCGTGEADPALMRRVAELVQAQGVGAWTTTPVESLLPPGTACPKCGSTVFRKETDILDVWFDSACSFAAVAEQRPNHSVPVDLYLEGSDQHRGWFHSALLVGVATRGQAPYRACLTHGFVVDGQGNKMSKSLGNTVSPEDITKRFGAEVLRLWVASSDYRDDVRLSIPILEGLTEGYRKLRNTLRYALSNLYDFDVDRDAVPHEQLRAIDHWVLSKLDGLVARVRSAYERYEFHLVFHSIVDFCAHELSAQYFDIQKDVLYTSRAHGPERRSAQTALERIARALVVMLAPVTSFTSEEAWAFLPQQKVASVFLADFPVPSGGWNEGLVRELDTLFEVRREVLPRLEEARREKRIGKSLEASVRLRCDGDLFDVLVRHHALLAELFIVSQVHLTHSEQPAFDVSVGAAGGHKCPRCWASRPEVGVQELCVRCTAAVAS